MVLSLQGILNKAAELKLGTKLDQPQSLLEFWKNHIKKRQLNMKDLANAKLAAMRPASAKPKQKKLEKAEVSKANKEI